ncbi:MAG: acetate kinase, partial [Synergistaceae bacterium]|nr:acetate kinase [Synergistaceae bacterium]
ALLPFIAKAENLNLDDVDALLNKKSGLLGISELSSDLRDVESAAEKGDAHAKLAEDVLNYGVKKFIGAYAAAMGGIDVLVFTAGVGENSASTRAAVCKGLEFLGIKIDPVKNDMRGKEMDISADGSKVRVLVIPTNEELMIARDTKRLAF